jgi:chitinase
MCSRFFAVVLVVGFLAAAPLGRTNTLAARTHASKTASAPAHHLLVGYYGDWDKTCPECWPISNVPFRYLSALNYDFADESHDACKLSTPAADSADDFPVIREMKKKYRRLRVLLSVGGSLNAPGFPQAVSSPARIRRLVSNCVALMRRTYPGVFDGIDIDWEGPYSAVEESEFTRLVKAFRTALGPRAPLTAAVYPDFSIGWKRVVPMLTWINLMTYDYHTPWSDSTTDFNAPMELDPADPAADYSITEDVNTMVTVNRVTAGKILLGIPLNGYGYAGVPSGTTHGLYQPFSGPTSWGTAAAGSFDYRDLVDNYVGENGYVKYGPNPYSGEVWLYNARQQVFISYDDLGTIAAKAAYLKKMGLGGAMVYDIAYDTKDSRSLTRALYLQLGNRRIIPSDAAVGS